MSMTLQFEQKEKISNILFSMRLYFVVGSDNNLRYRIPKKEKLFCSFGNVEPVCS